MAEQQKPARSLRLRRAPEQGASITVPLEAVNTLIEKAITPLLEQIAILQSNSITAGMILRNMKGSIDLAILSNDSTKARVDELLNGFSENLEELTSYTGLPAEPTGLAAFNNFVAVEAAMLAQRQEREQPRSATGRVTRRLYSGGVIPTNEGDDIVENVSSLDDLIPF